MSAAPPYPLLLVISILNLFVIVLKIAQSARVAHRKVGRVIETSALFAKPKSAKQRPVIQQ